MIFGRPKLVRSGLLVARSGSKWLGVARSVFSVARSGSLFLLTRCISRQHFKTRPLNVLLYHPAPTSVFHITDFGCDVNPAVA